MPSISFAIFRSAGVRFGLPLLLAVLMIMSLEPVLTSFSPYRGLLLVLPYILLSLVILLSQPFNQGKTALTALLMMMAFYIIQNYLQSPLSDNQTHIIYVLLATLLPLNLLQLHLLPERRLFSPLWNRLPDISHFSGRLGYIGCESLYRPKPKRAVE